MIENKNLVAYCGLYCGDCFLYKGEIADLARDLRKRLREAKFAQISDGMSKFAKELRRRHRQKGKEEEEPTGLLELR